MTTAKYVPERHHASLTPGESLKIIRELQGYTQTELARLTGIAQSHISPFESGKEEMGLKRVKVLAEALEVDPAVIAFPRWRPGSRSSRDDTQLAPARSIGERSSGSLRSSSSDVPNGRTAAPAAKKSSARRGRSRVA